MEYEDGTADQTVPLVMGRVAVEERRLRVQRAALYVCFAVFIGAKVLLLCWFLTQSFPYDAVSRLFRGDWEAMDDD